jgi:hypothetical protein
VLVVTSRESGQAALLLLGVLGALLLGTLVLFGFGQALGARGHAQRAADLSAVSAAQVMRRDFGRLFEPPVLEGGLPNPRHLTTDAYLSLARAAALRGARRNGVDPRRVRVAFPSGRFAPTQVTVAVADRVEVKLSSRRSRPVAVQASATAAITPASGLALPTQAAGGGYSGPLAYRQGKPIGCLFTTRATADPTCTGNLASRLCVACPSSRGVTTDGTALRLS